MFYGLLFETKKIDFNEFVKAPLSLSRLQLISEWMAEHKDLYEKLCSGGLTWHELITISPGEIEYRFYRAATADPVGIAEDFFDMSDSDPEYEFQLARLEETHGEKYVADILGERKEYREECCCDYSTSSSADESDDSSHSEGMSLDQGEEEEPGDDCLDEKDFGTTSLEGGVRYHDARYKLPEEPSYDPQPHKRYLDILIANRFSGYIKMC